MWSIGDAQLWLPLLDHLSCWVRCTNSLQMQCVCFCQSSGHGPVKAVDMALSKQWTWSCKSSGHGPLKAADMVLSKQWTWSCQSSGHGPVKAVDTVLSKQWTWSSQSSGHSPVKAADMVLSFLSIFHHIHVSLLTDSSGGRGPVIASYLIMYSCVCLQMQTVGVALSLYSVSLCIHILGYRCKQGAWPCHCITSHHVFIYFFTNASNGHGLVIV